MIMSGFAGCEVAMFDGTLSFESGSSDDCKHSEGFPTCGVLQAGGEIAGREQRRGTVNAHVVSHSKYTDVF